MQRIKHKTSCREFVRDMVRERDDYTCKDCGFKRTPKQVRKNNSKTKGLKGKIKSLDIHHLNDMCGKNSRGYDRVSTMNILITLCHKCHYNRPEHRVKSKAFRQKLTKTLSPTLI